MYRPRSEDLYGDVDSRASTPIRELAIPYVERSIGDTGGSGHQESMRPDSIHSDELRREVANDTDDIQQKDLWAELPFSGELSGGTFVLTECVSRCSTKSITRSLTRFPHLEHLVPDLQFFSIP